MCGIIVRKLLVTVALLFVLSASVFGLQQLAPGSIVNAVLQGTPRTPQLVQRIRHEYGLDRPTPVQYLLWIRNAVRLRFGRSYETGQPVLSAIMRVLPVSLELALYGFALATAMGVGWGVWCARRQRSFIDRILNGVSVVFGSTPAFIIATILLYIFTVQLNLFPSFGIGDGPGSRLWHLTLPALTLGLTGFSFILKLTRAGVIAAIDQDYYAFARARGVRGRALLYHYALRPGLIPLVTGASTIFTYMLTAAVVVEVAFSVPGLASLFIHAVSYSDLPMIQGVSLFVGTIVIIVNLIVDLSYRLIDPRVRFDGRAS